MKDLTRGSMCRNFLLFAIPMVLAGVLSQAYHTINTIIAGKMIGEAGLAAIGATSPLITFFNSVFWGYGTGIGIYVASLFGAKRYYRLKTVVINNVVAVSAVIFLLSLMMVVFRKQFYAVLQIDAAVIYEADIYYTICTLGNVAMIFSVICVYIFNAFGDGTFPLYMSFLSAILNITGNIFSVAVLKLGIAGIAFSTVFSATAVDACYIIKLRRCFSQLGTNRHKSHVNLKVLRDTVHFALPTMFQQSAMYFSTLLISPLVNSIGSAASASYTVTVRIYDINATIYQNAGKTVGNFVAQCVGAKTYDKIKKGLWFGLGQNILFMLPFFLVSVFLPRWICSLFFDQGASEVAIEYTVIFLKYYLPFILLNVVANLLHHFFRGVASMKPLLIATVCGSVVRIVVSIALAPALGIHGIYIGWISFWIADALVGFLMYLFSGWEKKLENKF
ncbi:MAG: hypothetical protein IKD04_05040 [Clostridia bacterium]|nr:hypothetical protein [Clostridia bacterium]